MSKLPSPEQFAQPVPESLSLATSVEDFSRFGRTQTMVAGGPDGYATGIPLDGTPLDIVQAGAEAQQLRTVVGRGDATYGVITCQRPDGSSFTVVRGVGADAKASLLGVGGSSKAVVLGAEAGSNASELRFGLDVRGSQLVITDRSHLNTPYDEQLSIVTANPAEAAPQQVAPNKTAARGLRRALGWLRDRRAKQTVPEQPQPAWALSP